MARNAYPPVPRLHRHYDLRHPDPLRVEIHSQHCDCAACAPYLQPVPAIDPPLTFRQIGNRVWLGLAIGTAIAFAIAPHGAWLALVTVFGSGR